MEKLYPPNIAGTLPAFCGKSITIPFSHNRAVSNDEVQGFSLKLKTIQKQVQITENASVPLSI